MMEYLEILKVLHRFASTLTKESMEEPDETGKELPKEELPIVFSALTPKGLKLIVQLSRIPTERARFQMLLRKLGKLTSTLVPIPRKPEGGNPTQVSGKAFIPSWGCGVSIAEGEGKYFDSAQQATDEGNRVLQEIARRYGFRHENGFIYA